jgi:dimethylhistidine N-methyltransferase
MNCLPTKQITFKDLHPALGDLRAEVLRGLKAPHKALPPKLFYDLKGSELFEQITGLPEYYPTRTEIGILEDRATEIAELMGEDCVLIEYGSGASRKIRILLDALGGNDRYVAIDISKEYLVESTCRLVDLYPRLDAYAVCADYSQPLELPAEALDGAGSRVVFFPGSTIGNFAPADALEFLRTTARQLGQGGSLLIGVDLKKDAAVLDAAYNDAEGVTAAFNLNLLSRLNRELNAEFDIATFAHRAFYNAAEGRIEMHLVSQCAQSVCVSGDVIRFAEGESIHTENSHKFTVDEFQALAAKAGFQSDHVWTDDERLFSVHFMSVS